ncbi:MAG TPA: hypothetical protein VLM78_05145, partial [Anaerolineales bacterium]|nr:hypothetical protein [Anaerolineales bacterium]
TLYPSDLWRAGDVIRDTHLLQLPADTPVPALYWLRLGLADESGARVTFNDNSDMLSLGPWRVRAKSTSLPPTYRTDVTVGESMTLHGYDVAVDESLTITLTWSTKTTPPQDYNVFVHLVGADGAMIAQHDGSPNQGRYPTMWWLPGDVIADVHILPIPASLPKETSLRVGMYDPITLIRLPITDADGARLPDDIISFPLP